MRRIARNYYVRLIVKAVVTLFVITSMTFFLIRLMPSNPIDVYVASQMAQGIPRSDAEAMASSMFQIDLKKPVALQYVDYLKGLSHGDFGKSIASTGTPVSKLVLRFLPWTLFSVTTGLILSFIVGVGLGTLAAYKRESWIDQIISAVSSIISSVPNYIVGILIIVYFGVAWHFFDFSAVRGSLSPGMHPEWSLNFFEDAFFHASLPIIVYVLTSAGGWVLAMRSNTLSTLGEDYVMVARARGLTDARIGSAYVGRNAVLPLFTMLTISIGFVVGGSALIESIFSYQGIGLQLGSALASRDYPVMQAIFIIICASVIGANVLTDFLYGFIDPRIRVQGR